VASSADIGEGAHDAAVQANGGYKRLGAHDEVADAGGAHDDNEADRTLTSGTVSKHTADSDEADTSDSAISSESLDALDDAARLTTPTRMSFSADGHGSRELVAAPRDIDD